MSFRKPAATGPSDPNKLQLAQSITCHAWNSDFTRLALCPNTKEVWIFKKDGGSWVIEHTLAEHDQVVTGIDWAPKTNRIVTCGQDRNAYVWSSENGVWKPTLVILRINRAATDVKWSPNEDKFAVASGAKCVSVCYFEKDNDWWVSKHIKKHKSTVLSIDWHPNNVLLATGSSDFNARVFSGFVRGVDKKPGETPYGTRLPFGELLAEYPSAGWVKCVRWSPSGNQLAFVSHDSSVTVMDAASGTPSVIKLRGLPMNSVVWVGETTIVAGGHDCYPHSYTKGGDGWVLGRNLDERKGPAQKQTTSTRAAFNMFQSKVETGQKANKTALQTKHQNQIGDVNLFEGNRVSTSGLDGKICLWDV